MQALTEVMGPQVAAEFYRTEGGIKLMQQAAQHLATVTVTDILANRQGNGAMPNQLQRLQDVPTGTDKPAVVRNLFEKSVKALSDPNVPPHVVETAAQNVFSPQGRDWLNQLVPHEQAKVYQMFTAPQVTARMKQIGEQYPQVWAQYKAWAEYNIKANIRSAAASLNEAYDTEGFKVQYDPATRKFSLDFTPTLPGPLGDLQRAGNLRSYQRAIDTVNAGFASLAGVYEAEGKGTVDKGLENAMVSLDINLERPKTVGLFERLVNGMVEGAKKIRESNQAEDKKALEEGTSPLENFRKMNQDAWERMKKDMNRNRDRQGSLGSESFGDNNVPNPAQNYAARAAGGRNPQMGELNETVTSALQQAGLTFGAPFRVTSANDSVHAGGSQHYVNNAVDIRVREEDGTPWSAAKRAAAVRALIQAGFTGIHEDGVHIHADMREGSRWRGNVHTPEVAAVMDELNFRSGARTAFPKRTKEQEGG